jgi:hypothetical protein
MKICLLDVNVLLALAWPHHTHHDTVHRWWGTAGLTAWATCLQTQLGFVRVSCNPRFAPAPASPGRAARLLHQMTSRSDHQFWNEIPGAFADPDLLQALSSVATHGHITDAYLALLARRHDGRLATLDRSLVAQHADVALLVSAG